MNLQRSSIVSHIVKDLWMKRSLIIQLTRNEISKRYKGSYLGILWSFLSPLLMLLIYTFVFSQVIHARWGGENASTGEFAVVLYCGLNIFTIFADSISRAPSLVVSNSNYVKKVIFPLEILPISIVGSAIVNGVLGFIVLLGAILIVKGSLPVTAFFLPLVILPIVMIALGLCWFLSSLGVYVRDVENLIGFLTTGLMFLSPIFYSITSIPPDMRAFFYLNPITYAVEDARQVLIWGQQPNWDMMFVEYLIAIAVMIFGYIWFQKTREGFADVM